MPSDIDTWQPVEFEQRLTAAVEELNARLRTAKFKNAEHFETTVRDVVSQVFEINRTLLDPVPQAFPDLSLGKWGIEVKFTEADSWRSVANSVLETNRDPHVRALYLIFGKMGGSSEVRWANYGESIMHVRTSHVPRFEVEIGTKSPLFTQLGLRYDDFCELPMSEKMIHIRRYARGRLKRGERLWWLEDNPEGPHSLAINVRLYTHLSDQEKRRIRAESILLCPRIVGPGTTRGKYDDAAMYMLTYHGVLAHQTRDLFSAGSVANPGNDDGGGNYIMRMLLLMESEIQLAATQMESALFVEYWGFDVSPKNRLGRWLQLADLFAVDWQPSKVLFSGHTN
jgi:hypothetical protein